MTITDRPDLQALDGVDTADDTPLGLASPMRVKKRDGGLEPVDLNKIVRAVAPRRRGARGRRPDACGDAHDQRPVRWRDHDGARRAEHPHGGRAGQRGAELQPPRRPPAATFIQKEVPTRTSTPSRSRSPPGTRPD